MRMFVGFVTTYSLLLDFYTFNVWSLLIDWVNKRSTLNPAVHKLPKLVYDNKVRLVSQSFS